MRQVDWSSVAKIFADAVELDGEARAAFLTAQCVEPELRAAVERLLEANALAEPEFLRGLDAESVAAMARVVGQSPEQVGAYRISALIARGGMGEVFLADRADGQFEQRVAVKLLKRGMDSDAILARFLRERQILAGLSHPNIARLLDGGVAADGRPYLVMEYVDGLTITRYCDAQRLSITRRLELFCLICQAVEYAHRNLILHRDLKPSNILVSADGVPKLLDFGIARVLAPAESDNAATLTESGALMLTPEYAAPEQFQGGAVTTATDVYSLGAVLYELLAGVRPFPERGRDTLARRDWQGEAPPLTGALPGQPDLEPIAQARSTDAVRLRRQLAGDLETITASALQSSTERRYASVEALRQDITRHLQQQPVLARPATASYRLSRFFRRHRVGVLSGVAMVLLVFAFAITALVQARRIRGQALALEVERDRARNEAEAAQRVSDFLVSVFETSDPLSPQGGGDSIPARALLDRGAARIETELDGQPHLLARMLGVIGRAYYNLSRSERAEPLLQRAVELQRAAAGDTSAAVVAALQQLADIQWRRGNHAAAQTTLQAALARQERIDARSPVMSSLLADLATAQHVSGSNQQVAATVASAMARLDNIPLDEYPSSRASLDKLSQFFSYTRDWDRLDIVYGKLVALEQAVAGPQSEAVATTYAHWAQARQFAGRIPAAESLALRAMPILRNIQARSVETANALVMLGAVARAAGAPDRADSLFRAAIDVYRERLGDDHRFVATTRSILATQLLRRERPHEAIPLLEQVIASFRKDADTSDVALMADYQFAVALRDAKRLTEAETHFRNALNRFEKRYPADYLLTANLRRDFAGALIELDRPTEADSMLRHAIRVLANRWGENDARVDVARIDLGRALTAQARYAEAEELLGAALRRLEQGRPPNDPVTQRARTAYAAMQQARSRGRAAR